VGNIYSQKCYLVLRLHIETVYINWLLLENIIVPFALNFQKHLNDFLITSLQERLGGCVCVDKANEIDFCIYT